MEISTEVYFNSTKIFLLCFYNSYNVNLWEKNVNKFLCRISSSYRSSHRRCSAKKVFLKLLHYSRESTCVRVSLQGFRSAILLKRLMFSCEYYETFKNTYFEEHLGTTASYFMEKNRHGWRLNKSSKKNLNQWKSMDFQFRKLTCLQRKIQRKMYTNLNKCQAENYPALPWRNLINTCNREICPGWTNWSFIPANRDHVITTYVVITRSPLAGMKFFKTDVFN